MLAHLIYDQEKGMFFRSEGRGPYRCLGPLNMGGRPINNFAYSVSNKPGRGYVATKMSCGIDRATKIEKVSNRKLLLLLNV